MHLPNFLREDYDEVMLTDNEFQKFHKIIHFNLKLLKYITILLYVDCINGQYKRVKVDKLLAGNFQRPTEGQWLSLLELVISQKDNFYKGKNKLFNTNLSKEVINDFNIFYSSLIKNFHNQKMDLSCYSFFIRIISIKNKQISHGIISEEQACDLNKHLIPVTEYIINILQPILETPIFLFHEGNNGEESYSGIHNFNEKNISKEQIEQGLYLVLNKKSYRLKPFIMCRDGRIYIYNSFDKKNSKVYYTGTVGRESYRKTSSDDIFELFNIEKDSLFIKSLESKVKTTSKGVVHNLPDRDYNNFIGRKEEFSQLEDMVCHKRHYMTALDGIGGVGKTALAYYLCDMIASNNDYNRMKFEYIVWLSAKTTKLVNGKIKKLEQSFEHLEQLIDSILDVFSFGEYKSFEIKKKKNTVYELLEITSCIIILDNLETLTEKNLNEIWTFIGDLPAPSKVLFTSREYSFSVPQILRIDSLSEYDALCFIRNTTKEIGCDITLTNEIEKRIIDLSSGLPIALKSIVGQFIYGKSIRSIENAIKNNTDDLSKFCFQEQLRKMNEDHLKVILLNALSDQELTIEEISFILGNLIKGDIYKIVDEIRSLSIIKRSVNENETIYSMLPLIKNFVLTSKNVNEYIDDIEKRLKDFYSIKETEEYSLLPIEERTINKASLLPRKIVDKAMKQAENDELEEAENSFNKCIRQYPEESYVWYMYSLFQSQYKVKYDDAISSLKQAISYDPNYIYYKKIGDLHLKLKNYDTSIKYYRSAISKSEIEKNRNEMKYLIGNVYFQKVKKIRRELRMSRSEDLFSYRNDCYDNIVRLFEEYISKQPTIYDGKKIKIFRILSESYFGLSKYDNAIEYIDKAIDLSEYDDNHVEFRHVILSKQKKSPNKIY
jgi:tetratricopeptide (TPR) repeat protein